MAGFDWTRPHEKWPFYGAKDRVGGSGWNGGQIPGIPWHPSLAPVHAIVMGGVEAIVGLKGSRHGSAAF